MRKLSIELNQQQFEVIDMMTARFAASGEPAAVLKSAFVDYGRRLISGDIGRDNDANGEKYVVPAVDKAEYGAVRAEFILEPVSGEALTVLEGEVLRIVQEEDGGQCVDFNAFNLADYKERLDVGRTRAWNGIFPKQGGMLYSNSPRDRAMFEILAMPENCRAETLGARCNGALLERGLGFAVHTNCQDTFAECIGAYGLTPDDVHDSFNMWMNTEIGPDGRLSVSQNTGSRGEYVDLLAMFDTVSVPIVCGSGDVMFTSNFSFKKLRVQIFEASEKTRARTAEVRERFARLRNVRTPHDFRVDAIKADRALERDPNYEPAFVNFPLTMSEIVIELDAEDQELLQRVRTEGSTPGNSDAELVRSCAMLSHLRRPDAAIRR